MSSDAKSDNPLPAPSQMAKVASELNNLLQIISGTSSLVSAEPNGEDSQKYMEMLRTSIERAEKIAADLGGQAGGTHQKVVMPSALAGFRRSTKTSSPTLRKHSILLVDDEQMALTLVKRVLTEAGFDVTTAESGFECMDAFRREPFGYDLVLLDLTMPFMDGEETFRRLREIRNDVPVVLCTGFVQEERLTQMMASGLSGFLRKPVPPDEMIAVVSSTLQNAKYSRGNMENAGITAAV